MPPLSQALFVQEVQRSQPDSKESLWTGTIDLEWTVALVPNGGYVIGLILESCIAHQKSHSPKVVDPVHVSAHFLRPVQGVIASQNQSGSSAKQPAPFEVHVKSIKGGSSMNNLQADLIQNEQIMVTTHLIFGVSALLNTESPQKTQMKTLVPPSPFARRIPLRTHPSCCPDIALHPSWNFKKHISGKEDPVFKRLNGAETRPSLAAPDSNEREPPGLEFGSWLTLEDEVDPLRSSMLPFCADIIKPLPELLPPEVNPFVGKTWYPTLTMTIEFKAPITLESHAEKTFGLYAVGRFFQEPLGRHETIIEVWTSPKHEAGKGSDFGNKAWRENQRCLVIATQTALCIPFDAQLKSMQSKV
ncbi:hypothetical protein ACEPAF_352 [Sanghuangporus sanghuang]